MKLEPNTKSEELKRLDEARLKKVHWRRWGPYLSERQWGTVREDYSPDGSAWDSFPHHHAISRAYRWGEDGIAGISDNHQRLCFSIGMWNGVDPILKERLYGLTWSQGNHGEAVKEIYFYADSTPTHSYMKYLYRYPHQRFPYELLLEESRRRTRNDPEIEIQETGIFDQHRYFDVTVEFAKESADDLFIKILVENRGDELKEFLLLPNFWFRNTWSWHKGAVKPNMKLGLKNGDGASIHAIHPSLGEYYLSCDGASNVLFTENDSNHQRLYGQPNLSAHTKDAFHRYFIEKEVAAVNPKEIGTKACAVYQLKLAPKGSAVVHLRLSRKPSSTLRLAQSCEDTVATRKSEADAFYYSLSPSGISEDARNIQRQAFAGLMWTKQYYHYVVSDWIEGDETAPPPPPSRKHGRNHNWTHLYNDDVLSMPDKWEYPWFASWDLAFHVIPIAMVDPDFAKRQLVLLTREWYMHPNGQIPAYEWDFNDVTPPVHVWAAWRIYKIEKRTFGRVDREFLERVFQKLLLNFTWWVNRKDPKGQNVFEGGFLGLDNIGVFDRSKELPTGGKIKQSDSTSWMAMYCLNMLVIAIELAKENRAYEDIASKFFEHFLYIAYAINHRGDENISLWDEEDGFYYDILHLPDNSVQMLKVRSLVGLIPLFGVLTLEPEIVDMLPGFKSRLQWFINNRPDLQADVASMEKPGAGKRMLLALVNKERLLRILKRMLDPNEFLSPYGIRSVSKYHEEHPYRLKAGGEEFRVDYEPAESESSIYGGNSNWRGPIWWPLNFLLIESIQRFSHYYGDELKVECPTGSGNYMTLWEVSTELSMRLLKLFLRDENGDRAYLHGREMSGMPDFWNDHLLFHEYFHGDNGRGLGASHQTGWTAIVAKLIQQCSDNLKP